MKTDRYGRTIGRLMETFTEQGIPCSDDGLACTNPDCPDWEVGADGIFWLHSHAEHVSA
jgi:hypothetical protein